MIVPILNCSIALRGTSLLSGALSPLLPAAYAAQHRSLAALAASWSPALSSTTASGEPTSSAVPCNPTMSPSTSRSYSSRSDQSSGSQPVEWDWGFVAGSKAGRKPAIKRPKRHQWYFCNPNYDPSTKPSGGRGAHRMVPYAPASASLKEDWQAFQQADRQAGVSYRKHRQAFTRYLQLRDWDWKAAFEDGMSKYVKDEKKKLKREEEAKRQQAWREYKQRIFQSALIPSDVLAEVSGSERAEKSTE